MSAILWENIRTSGGYINYNSGASATIQIRWTPVFSGTPYGFTTSIGYAGGARPWVLGISPGHPLSADGVDLYLVNTNTNAALFTTVVGVYWIAIGPTLNSRAPQL